MLPVLDIFRGRTGLSLAMMLAWLAVTPFLAVVAQPGQAQAALLQLDPNMETTWKRTDVLVAQGTVSRSWLWGPQAFNIAAEEYDGVAGAGEIPAGKRLVAYYDKSRMEINNPFGDRSGKYFVTNGLLVRELISGRRAFGDTRSVPYLPAEIPVVGDSSGNPLAPTYASLFGVASIDLGRNVAPNRTGQIVSTAIDRNGNTREDLRYSVYNLQISRYDTVFGHNVPAVFWDFMNSRGKVLENNQVVDGPVVDWLFSTGYAITEPFWTLSKVGGGAEKDVLVQCFERRCLSYTPSNPAAFRVEMGNVGRHYFEWRYNTPEARCPTNPVRGFGKVWADNPSVKARLSCPYGYVSEQGTKVAVQNFERGRMVWVSANTGSPNLPYLKTIFVLFNDNSYVAIQDTWDESQPANGGLTPPPGLYEPQRGFGNVWRNQTGLKIRERLGWATNQEQNSDGAFQGFYGGLMIWLGPSINEILVGYRYFDRTNVWEIYPDKFEG